MKISKEARVGLFAAISIGLLYFGYNFLRGKKFFSAYKTYYIIYNDADGLVNSTPVYINGVKHGQVESVTLPDYSKTDSILITLFINKKIKIGTGAIARVTKPSFLEGNIISIENIDSGEFKEGATYLHGIRDLDITTTINNMVAPIRNKSEQVLITLDKVLGSLREVFNEKGTVNLSNSVVDFSATIHSLRLTAENLNQIVSKEVGQLSNTINNMQSITANLAQSNNEINKTLKNVSLISDSLANSNLKMAINNLSILIAELSLMSSKINKGEGTLGLLANDEKLYENLNKSTKELNALLKDIQRYPGRYINVSVFGGPAKDTEKKREKDINNGTYKPE